MDLVATVSAEAKAIAVIAITVVGAPIAGIVFRRVGGGWDAVGGGPFSILREQSVQRRRGGPAPDPAIQAAEVRQMLEAKSDRRRRRGEAPLDVEAETERLLAEARATVDPQDSLDAELRAEVRQLVVARNERRLRKGVEPLDVEAETDRQLADLVGSR